MAEAIWAAIQDLLKELIDENTIYKINLILDSPVSQYRNKTTIFKMKKFAIDYSIDIKWIFSEYSHGKGAEDAIGAAIKHKFDEIIAVYLDTAFSNTLDLINSSINIANMKKTIPQLKTVSTGKENF
jgi:hypothetical protein